MRLPDGHLPIDPNVHLDGDRGPDAARAEVVGLFNGGIGGDDPQNLRLGLGGERLFEQLAEARTDQIESDLEDEDGDNERRNRIGDTPLLSEKKGAADADQRSKRRKRIAALATTLGLSIARPTRTV